MKKTLTVLMFALLVCFAGRAKAQAYDYAFGVVGGNMQALSFKAFLSDEFALQADLGTKITLPAGANLWACPWTFELNPNAMWEPEIGRSDCHFLLGGGVSLGMLFGANSGAYNVTYAAGQLQGKFGVNAIAGVEYVFRAPVALQFDFRPGYGMLFNSYYTNHYFDWGLNLGIRYTF